MIWLALSLKVGLWDHDIFDYIADEYKENVIIDMKIINADQKCPEDWSSIRATFPGQHDYCYGYTKKVRSPCRSKSKSERLVEGVNRKKMRKIEGKLICFKRAESWDYNEVVEQRTKINNFGECNSG